MTVRRAPVSFAMLPALLLAAVLGAACGAAMSSQTVPAAPADTAGGSPAELEALFRERAAAARSRFTDADVRFMTDMIPHHAQAVSMANMAGSRGASTAVQTLAARIRSSQVDEIGIMQQWLRERGRPVPEVDVTADVPAAHADHAHHAGAMPGMLTAERFATLERARGAGFDRLFLTYMIEHHRGAVTMVDALLAADGAAQDATVFRLASDISVEQKAEIARMQQMLRNLFQPGYM